MVDVVFYRGEAQTEVARDLLIGQTPADQLENFPFAPRQRLIQVFRLRVTIHAKERTQKASGNLRSTCETPGHDVGKGLTEFVNGNAPGDITAEPGPPATNNILPLFLKTKRHQRDIRMLRGDCAYFIKIDALRHIDQDGIHLHRLKQLSQMGQIADGRLQGDFYVAKKAGGQTFAE